MKTMIFALGLAGLCASAMYAQNPLSTELKQSYTTEKENITQGAEKMPEADYSFKATPAQRSYGEIITHIADAQGSICASVKGDGKKFGNAPTDKAGAVAYLKSVFDYCDPVYESMTDQQGLEMTKMFGRDRTKYGTLEFAIQHDNEMYGQMVGYLRLKGIVPPSTERSLENAAKKKK